MRVCYQRDPPRLENGSFLGAFLSASNKYVEILCYLREPFQHFGCIQKLSGLFLTKFENSTEMLCYFLYYFLKTLVFGGSPKIWQPVTPLVGGESVINGATPSSLNSNSSFSLVTIYIDKSVSNKYMESSVSDLQNLKPEVKVTYDMSNWTEYSFVVFSNLNAVPSMSDKMFAQAIKELFEKHLDMNVNPEVSIIFGQNMRGLIALHELVKLRPNLRKNCAAVSSISFQARKVSLFARRLGGGGGERE